LCRHPFQEALDLSDSPPLGSDIGATPFFGDGD
jgi:hypothetical protein